MEKGIIGANAQKPVSAMEKAFLDEYEANMADAHAKEYFEYVNLSDIEKLDWIRTNDAEAYETFTKKNRKMEYGN